MNEELKLLREKKGFICDMDGVIYHGNRLLPGVTEFVDWLQRENKSFLFLTNSSERSPLELQQKLARLMMSAGFGDIDMEGKYVAIKLHFGEPGNMAYLRPNWAKAVADLVKSRAASRF